MDDKLALKLGACFTVGPVGVAPFLHEAHESMEMRNVAETRKYQKELANIKHKIKTTFDTSM